MHFYLLLNPKATLRKHLEVKLLSKTLKVKRLHKVQSDKIHRMIRKGPLNNSTKRKVKKIKLQINPNKITTFKRLNTLERACLFSNNKTGRLP